MSLQHAVLLPGLLCDAALWARQRSDLAAVADIHIPDLTQDDTLAGMAERVLAAAPRHFALAGLSMGGYLAFEIMRRAPERVTRLCLIATTAAPDTPAESRRRRILANLVAGQQRFLGVSTRLLPELLHRDSAADAALVESIVAMSLRVGRDAYIRQQHAIMRRPDSRPDLPGIAVPTTILAGDTDHVTPPAAAAEMAALIPAAVLRIIPASGHLPPLEQPAAVTHAMHAWLTA